VVGWPTDFVLCAVHGPVTHVFHQCRTNATQNFRIFDTCLSRQVIRIQSAEVGFSDPCPLNDATCTRPTNHTEIMNCNGQRTCSISQSVLNYPPDDKLCGQHQNGTFIKITYDCINGE